MNRNQYKIKYKRSPVPFYAVGVWWLVYVMLFPLFMWYHFAVIIGMSVFVYFLFNRIFSPQQIKIEMPYRAPLSGDTGVDKVIKNAENCLQSIYDSTGKIAAFDSIFAGKIASLIAEGRKILEYLSVNTGKITMLRRFFNYYLPTLDKLLKNYIVIIKNKTRDKDYLETKEEIEEAVTTMETVFGKQLNKLLDDIALDITTDINVLETLLAMNGLSAIDQPNLNGGDANEQ